MLDAVIRFSLRSRLLVLVASVALLVGGGYLATTLPIDVFPDLDRPRLCFVTVVAHVDPVAVLDLCTCLGGAALPATDLDRPRHCCVSVVGLVDPVDVLDGTRVPFAFPP